MANTEEETLSSSSSESDSPSESDEIEGGNDHYAIPHIFSRFVKTLELPGLYAPYFPVLNKMRLTRLAYQEIQTIPEAAWIEKYVDGELDELTRTDIEHLSSIDPFKKRIKSIHEMAMQAENLKELAILKRSRITDFKSSCICCNSQEYPIAPEEEKDIRSPELVHVDYSEYQAAIPEPECRVIHNSENELQYLQCVREVLRDGAFQHDRTKVNTISCFVKVMRFSLRDGNFPLLTTKRMFWKTVVEELLWIISGSTDSEKLAAKGVHIWDANGSREFLDKCGMKHKRVGDLGPTYGFQWRHSGAEYIDADTDYTGQGIDQLQDCINEIKTNPSSRRIIMNSWIPRDVKNVALPPCHTMCQFYVTNDELSCCLTQRSGDMGLGIPYNIASYSLLTILIAKICNLKPKEFVHVVGDCHIYSTHISQLREQILREPYCPPTVRIKPRQSIDDFVPEDIELIGYKCHPKIEMKMAL